MSPMFVEPIDWNNYGPTFCCMRWFTFIFVSTFYGFLST